MNPMDNPGQGGAKPSSSAGPGPHISLLQLDRLMAGDLPEAEALELRKAVAASPELQRYLSAYGGLESGMTLRQALAKTPRAVAGRAHAGGKAGASDWISGVMGAFGSRKAGMALAFATVLGVGLWSWQARESARAVVDESGESASPYRAKGMDAPGIRLVVKGAEYETGDLIQARSGDTLGFAYRSPYPVRAQIWYREEGRAAEEMTGSQTLLEWKAAMGWRRTPENVILEGDWKRQIVWIVWSKSEFTAEQARQALEAAGAKGDKGSQGPDDKDAAGAVHAEAFRLAGPD
jgi:hypothetical protein